MVEARAEGPLAGVSGAREEVMAAVTPTATSGGKVAERVAGSRESNISRGGWSVANVTTLSMPTAGGEILVAIIAVPRGV